VVAVSDARWSLRNIYLYVVCLITLIMVIVGAAGVVRTAVELAYPDPGAYFDPYAPVKVGGEMTEADIEEQQRRWQAQSTRQGVLDLAGNIALVVIAGPLYLYHWRKIEIEKDEPPVSPSAN
jgi:hypothetical protein